MFNAATLRLEPAKTQKFGVPAAGILSPYLKAHILLSIGVLGKDAPLQKRRQGLKACRVRHNLKKPPGTGQPAPGGQYQTLPFKSVV
ncbi:MAG TPA: hypothetical protein DHV36_14740 [Desulfobacteraceae bacterium]|nr:hypothetical protein [Desulfobacteraceae bacterium]|tara:strand:+ start:1846 stop:2106 length:261 start_codon:yes stop_codon:yes gene_type:complete